MGGKGWGGNFDWGFVWGCVPVNAQGALWDCKCFPVNAQGDQRGCIDSRDGPGIQRDWVGVCVCGRGGRRKTWVRDIEGRAACKVQLDCAHRTTGVVSKRWSLQCGGGGASWRRALLRIFVLLLSQIYYAWVSFCFLFFFLFPRRISNNGCPNDTGDAQFTWPTTRLASCG